MEDKHIVVITQVNPYTPVGGVTVVLKNLFSTYSNDSYTFAYLGRFSKKLNKEAELKTDIYRLIPNFHIIQLLGYFFPKLKRLFAIRRGVKLVKQRKAHCIVGLYPTLNSLEVSVEVAKRTGVPYYPYLHDTVKEGLAHLQFAERGAAVQEEVFKTAKKIITMSEGMSDFYEKEYNGLVTYPLEHSFPETLAEEPNFNRNKDGFWGGEVYKINDQSFARVQNALLEENTQFTVTSLSKLTINKTSNVFQTFFPSRAEYLEAVKEHGVLVLSINWPDETDVDIAELSTIFPTKTIEYLATGSPILVHCPEDYFLAKFFRKHQCGVVVSERDTDLLREAIQKLQSKDEEVHEMQRKALAATQLFSIENIQKKFEDILLRD